MAFELRKEIDQTKSLASDKDLAREYINLIKNDLLTPELRLTADDLDVSADWLQATCVSSADRLFAEAKEYDAYLRAKERRAEIIDAARTVKESRRAQFWIRATSAVAFLLGPVVIAVMAILQIWIHRMPIHDYTIPAIALACIFLASFLIGAARTAEWRLRLEIEDARSAKFMVETTRDNLFTAIRTSYLLPFATTILNEKRTGNLSHEYSVRRATGLSDFADESFHVPTAGFDHLENVMRNVSGQHWNCRQPRLWKISIAREILLRNTDARSVVNKRSALSRFGSGWIRRSGFSLVYVYDALYTSFGENPDGFVEEAQPTDQ